MIEFTKGFLKSGGSCQPIRAVSHKDKQLLNVSNTSESDIKLVLRWQKRNECRKLCLHSQHTNTHTQGNDTLCMEYTFPVVIICAEVLIFEHYVPNLLCFSQMGSLECCFLQDLVVVVCVRVSVNVWVCTLCDIAVLAYSLSGKINTLSQHESRRFHYRFKIQQLHSLSIHSAILIPAKALDCQILQEVPLNSCWVQCNLFFFFFSQYSPPEINFLHQKQSWWVD